MDHALDDSKHALDHLLGYEHGHALRTAEDLSEDFVRAVVTDVFPALGAGVGSGYARMVGTVGDFLRHAFSP